MALYPNLNKITQRKGQSMCCNHNQQRTYLLDDHEAMCLFRCICYDLSQLDYFQNNHTKMFTSFCARQQTAIQIADRFRCKVACSRLEKQLHIKYIQGQNIRRKLGIRIKLSLVCELKFVLQWTSSESEAGKPTFFSTINLPLQWRWHVSSPEYLPRTESAGIRPSFAEYNKW
jgi:hypothetical protein